MIKIYVTINIKCIIYISTFLCPQRAVSFNPSKFGSCTGGLALCKVCAESLLFLELHPFYMLTYFKTAFSSVLGLKTFGMITRGSNLQKPPPTNNFNTSLNRNDNIHITNNKYIRHFHSFT